MRNLFLIMMLVGCKSIQPVGSIFDTAEKVKEVPNAIQDVSKTVNTVENISSVTNSKGFSPYVLVVLVALACGHLLWKEAGMGWFRKRYGNL